MPYNYTEEIIADESYKSEYHNRDIYATIGKKEYKIIKKRQLDEAKKIIEDVLRKAFDNCRLIEDFEDKTKLNNIYDFMTEDHFYVGYINKTLEGELMKYQKR